MGFETVNLHRHTMTVMMIPLDGVMPPAGSGAR